MIRPKKPVAKSGIDAPYRLLLAIWLFLACHGSIAAQDALKPTDFKHYGDWVLTEKNFQPANAAPMGDLHYQKRLPENFEIIFRWTEMGKHNSERPAGGLRFTLGQSYSVGSHSGAYGRKISCDFSDFSLNFHTKDPTLPAKMTSSNQGDMIGGGNPNNFLKPPGKENQGRLACFGDTVQVIVNDHLVYHFNIRSVISEIEPPNSSTEPPIDLKFWNDSRKRGLFLSVTALLPKEGTDFSIINGISIRDFGKSADNAFSPLIDPKTSRYADWCRNDRWNFTDDAVYKKVNDFLIARKCRFARTVGGLLPNFDGMTNPGGTNNAILIRPLLPYGFNQETQATRIIPSFFRAYLNDDFQSCINIMRFRDEAIAKQQFKLSEECNLELIKDGHFFQSLSGDYVMIIFRSNTESSKNDFLAFCKKVAESMR